MTDNTQPNYFAILVNEDEPETSLYEVHELFIDEDTVPADEAAALAESMGMDLTAVATGEELKAIGDSIVFPPDPTNHWWAFNVTTQRFVSVGDHEEMDDDDMRQIARQYRRDHGSENHLYAPVHAVDALQLKCAIRSALLTAQENEDEEV